MPQNQPQLSVCDSRGRGWMELPRDAGADPAPCDCAPLNTAILLAGHLLTKGAGKAPSERGHSAGEEDGERSGLLRQGKYYRDYERDFFFLLKDIIPNVINCGLALMSVLPSDYCRVSLDLDQFNWNQNTAEGVWELLSIFNTPETWLGM